ncbi:MAG: TlpA family protein disulfide reductase [Gemmatimonadota bacterium]
MSRLLGPAALAVVMACVPTAGAEIGLAVGTRAPAVRLPALQYGNDTLDLTAYIGRQVVVLAFWASWCPQCERLEPAIRTAHERFGADITFITIAVPQSQTPERVRRYIARNRMPGLWAFDANKTAITAFRVPHPAYVVVIDRSGTIAYTGVGSDQDIAAVLAALDAGGQFSVVSSPPPLQPAN